MVKNEEVKEIGMRVAQVHSPSVSLLPSDIANIHFVSSLKLTCYSSVSDVMNDLSELVPHHTLTHPVVNQFRSDLLEFLEACSKFKKSVRA